MKELWRFSAQDALTVVASAQEFIRPGIIKVWQKFVDYINASIAAENSRQSKCSMRVRISRF
jgi:hypothetical protein